ncbi:MAG: MerR family transcriptional regulator [Pseudomonadota bacterium]
MTEAAQDTYGIGAVAKLTGLSDHTIRVWERRYEAVVTTRSATGRRVYTIADVEKLKLLKLLTDRGLTIGRIANESSEMLKKRLSAMNEVTARAGLDKLRVALAGDFLPSLVRDYDDALGVLEFAVVASGLRQLEADLKHESVDALILELPTVSAANIDRILGLRSLGGARLCIAVYTFARSADLERLQAQGVTPLRAPVRIDELRNALLKLADLGPSATKKAPAEEIPESEWPLEELAAPRRFSREQLGRLSRMVSSIDCECPQHLAQLAADLAAFELYSAGCANRDDDDRALHDYLHRTTARARARIEEALERVVRSEGLEY